MKFTIDIECTPEEARAFLGLPDLKPMQDALVDEMRGRMSAAIAGMEPDALLRQWMPGGVQGLEQIQKMFWNLAAGDGKPKP